MIHIQAGKRLLPPFLVGLRDIPRGSPHERRASCFAMNSCGSSAARRTLRHEIFPRMDSSVAVPSVNKPSVIKNAVSGDLLANGRGRRLAVAIAPPIAERVTYLQSISDECFMSVKYIGRINNIGFIRASRRFILVSLIIPSTDQRAQYHDRSAVYNYLTRLYRPLSLALYVSLSRALPRHLTGHNIARGSPM